MTTKRLLSVFCISIAMFICSSTFAADRLMVAGGAVWGGWSLDNSCAMVQDADNLDVFVYTGWFDANEEFKFFTEAEFGKDEYRNAGETYLNGTGTLRLNGDDTKFKLAEAGNYTITCNLASLVITANKIDYQTNHIRHSILFLIGDATPAGWELANAIQLTNTVENPFIFNGETALVNSGGFKICINKYAGYGQKMYYRDVNNSGLISEDATGDRQWSVTESGNYLVSIDLLAKTISITKKTEVGMPFSTKQIDITVASLGQKIFRLSGEANANVLVSNLQGSVVKLQATIGTNRILDLSDLPNGVYLLKITTQGLSQCHKIIVKN
jgi:hypothetical protein